MVPGEILTKDEDILLNAGVTTVSLSVANTGDRPIQVGSHYHFYETNEALKFDRASAKGMRLRRIPFALALSNLSASLVS